MIVVSQRASGQDSLEKCLPVFKPHEVPIGLSAEKVRGHHVDRHVESPFIVPALTGKVREDFVALVEPHGREHRHVSDVFVRDNRGLLDFEVNRPGFGGGSNL